MEVIPITKEMWKDIKGYEGLYRISNHGNILSCRQNIIMKQKITKGYRMVGFTKNKKHKSYSVHRLVAEAFIQNPKDKREVNHLDENKLNNHVSNLKWATSKENSNWGTRNERIAEFVKTNPPKISKKIKQIDKDTGEIIKIYNSVSEASGQNKFHQGNISSCLTGKRKYASGYKWEYVD
ncbi:MAG TPA: hypothetical protein GX707_06350 [Epulopiscium sp.]|nr:hypothetical protein [Candidatus Epulonipiscium sp.]